MLTTILITAALSVAAALVVVLLALRDVANEPSIWSGRIWRAEPDGSITVIQRPPARR